MKEAWSWLRKAEDDLKTAEVCMKGKRLDASAFHSQQAAEKALKAVQILTLEKFDKVHDLLALAGSVKAPDGVVRHCIKLNPYYTITRYPDVLEPTTEETAKELVKESREVVEWAKRTVKS